MKDFAADWPRDEHGWVLFPWNDTDYRSQMFPQEVNKHPAKANMYLVQAVVDYVSEPEQTIMDIMAGTGTLMIAAMVGRRVILVELSEKFFELQQEAVRMMENIVPGVEDQIMLVNSACQLVLPITADHIVFSPPYAGIMKSKGTDKLTMEKTDYDMFEYQDQSNFNVGLGNEFIYHRKMKKIYQLCWDSLPAGGTLTIIVKDHIADGKVVHLSGRAEEDCKKIGFELDRWERWPVLGSMYTRIYRSQGKLTVDHEDCIILRRPQ